MLKLMELEIKKFKIIGNVKGVIIANLIMLSILIMGVYAAKIDSNEIMFRNYNDVFLFTGIMVRGTFTIFAGVLISRIIIGEYKNKTINILFTYPINRKKIMVAKLAIVVIFAFTTMILSNLFLGFSIIIFNIFASFIQDTLTVDILLKNLSNILMYSTAFAFVSLIPVYVGMRKKSGSATIVTSIILVSLLNSGNQGYTLASNIIIPLILAIIGVAISYLSIKDVESVDVVSC